jgi:hypothetical protein
MATANCTITWTVDGSSQEQTSFSKTDAGTIAALDVDALAIPVTNQLYNLTIDVSQIKFIVMIASADCTVEFNNSSSGTPTVTLVANEPYIWWVNAPWTNVLNVDVTALYLTAAGSGTMNFTLRGIVDPTP